ncbi:MAG TPA: hypothetical protein VMY99_01680 [Nevskiaceae bacterium]|nr:hypothetical protein [Nevskiaceae bacterium]
MLWTILVVLITLGILLAAEWLSRARGIHAELTRKFVHMAVGTFVAFWPFFLSWSQIQVLSFAFFVVVLASIKFDIFRSIHAVKRNASGELLFAMVIGFLSLIAQTPWVFAAAMLNLSLADGLAAIVGLLYGDNNQYKVFGRTKSKAGTAAFFITSLLIMVAVALFSNESVTPLAFILIPALAAITENVAPHGSDNLVMPLLVALLLSSSL